MGNKTHYDCIIIGAGPGGLQAAIHLARYNRRILLVDRGGGLTSHARHLVNYLGIRNISGSELIATGLRQIGNFSAEVAAATVTGIAKQELFTVRITENTYQSRFVIAAGQSAAAIDINSQFLALQESTSGQQPLPPLLNSQFKGI